MQLPKQQSRRKFIQTGMVWTGWVGLSSIFTSCASLEQYLMGQAADGQEKVVILGGGASGLAAALNLKKQQIPFRIFEGSDRLGGRAYTVSDFNLSAQHCELGAEWILPQHQAVLSLAKELRVSLKEEKGRDSFSWFVDQKSKGDTRVFISKLTALIKKLHFEVFRGDFAQLTEENKHLYSRAFVLHQISALDLLKRMSNELSQEQAHFLKVYTRWFFGAELDQVSALSLINSYLESNTINASRIYRFTGGSGVLMRAIFDRLSGVMPGQFVRFQHQLIKVKRYASGTELIFRTPWGDKSIKAQNVVCSLPLSCLREVEGIDEMEFAPSTLKWIHEQTYGNHSKLALSFQEPGWRKNPMLNQNKKWLIDEQWLSVGMSSDVFMNAGRGVLSKVFGGLESKDAGLHSIPEMLKHLTFLKADTWKYENLYAIKDWRQSKWSRGSLSFTKPGDFLRSSQSLQNQIGNWVLCGEHTSLYPGTLNGAIESGFSAAKHIVQRGQKLISSNSSSNPNLEFL